MDVVCWADVNECLDAGACANELERCVDELGGYRCEPITVVLECHVICQNNGSCHVNDDGGDDFCECAAGFTGARFSSVRIE